MASETLVDSEPRVSGPQSMQPGVVVVWTGVEPTLQAHAVPAAGFVFGRQSWPADGRLSRKHVRIRANGQGFEVDDLGSRNGTRVCGELIDKPTRCDANSVIRVGRTVLLTTSDFGSFADHAIVGGRGVAGPRLSESWGRIARAAASDATVLLRGETGVGKEVAARVFAEAAAPSGPFVAVNCAAIPSALAESLLFGTRKGAYSGADADADGYFKTADGGTLFLDEVADLDLTVQAKLLRALESGEVWPLGASKPIRVKTQVIAATSRDVPLAIEEKRFRDDLFYRIARPEVVIPPLRERLEEIPWLAWTALNDRADDSTELALESRLVEECMLRSWPGNARELLSAVRGAIETARHDDRRAVTDLDLDPGAGNSRGTSDNIASVLPADEAIVAQLRASGGNVSHAARELALHRNQLRRWLSRHSELAAELDELRQLKAKRR